MCQIISIDTHDKPRTANNTIMFIPSLSSLRTIARALTTRSQRYLRYYTALDTLRQQRVVDTAYDLVYVTPPVEHQGWILDAICREIDRHFQGASAFAPCDLAVPTAKAYFYSHYGFFQSVLRRQPEVIRAKNILFYTHPRTLWFSDDEMRFLFRQSDCVLSMCSLFMRQLKRDGVENVRLGLVGADPKMFVRHERGSKRIGFCSGYYPRKDGNRILQIVSSMPDHQFVLCGPRWDNWDRFPQLLSLPNFEYINPPYASYPEFYASLDVFVSVSTLEGGPVPLIESMMCNVVPVVSRTGHAEDIVEHGSNGFIFDVDAPLSEICASIERALSFDGDVSGSVAHLTWERFSHQVQEIAGLRHAQTHSARMADAQHSGEIPGEQTS